MQAVFTLLAGLGILTALLGWNRISAGGAPGLNLPQGMLIVGGLMLSLVAFRLRRADARQRVWGRMRKRWLPGLVAAAVTLIVLEFVLAAVDSPPLHFPPDPLQELLEPQWRWTCDEVGCRYDYDAAVLACGDKRLTAGRGGPSFPNRWCIFNRQGFHDTEDFVAGDDFDERMRILMLGDSYTMGASADIGKSYVETIEANFPQSVVWNTGMLGAGTHQALAVFRAYAPVLQPQLTILGFFANNDFNDNLLPMDLRLWVGVANDGRVLLRRHDDDSGNAISLDEKKDYYYCARGVEPPANEIERAVGRTRLGSLLLRMIDREPPESPCTGWRLMVDTTRGYLRDLREAAAAQDTALLILLIPGPNDIPSPGGRYRSALQLFEELGLAYLNPIHLLDSDLDYPPDGFHWNSVGHQKIGAVLSDCIEAFQVSGDLADCEGVKMP